MKKFSYQFTSHFKYTAVISAILLLLSVVVLLKKGLVYGVDFRGGAEIQVKLSKEHNLGSLRGVLTDNGYKSAQVQSLGESSENEFLIKVQASEQNLNEVSSAIGNLLLTKFSNDGVEIRKTDIVGPKAGAELRISGAKAMAYALIAIFVYIALRFDFKYSPGAIVAVIHDVLLILGIFVLTEKEFSLQIVAALLAVIGYSVNDTVVVYDRVREHEEKFAGRKLTEHINNAINETLSRTLLTSLTTFIVSIIMFIFGGPVIHDFFFAITLGVIIGTYSSIYVAAPATLFFNQFNKGS